MSAAEVGSGRISRTLTPIPAQAVALGSRCDGCRSLAALGQLFSLPDIIGHQFVIRSVVFVRWFVDLSPEE